MLDVSFPLKGLINLIIHLFTCPIWKANAVSNLMVAWYRPIGPAQLYLIDQHITVNAYLPALERHSIIQYTLYSLCTLLVREYKLRNSSTSTHL